MNLQELRKTEALKHKRYKCQFDKLSIDELTQFQREVTEAYDRIPLAIQFVDYDPYCNLREMTNGINDTGILYISSLHNDSKLLPDELNLKFRAVHDFIHYLFQCPFGFEGEYQACQIQMNYHKSNVGKAILYSEIVMQAAYAEYFGEFAEDQKVIITKSNHS
jgi:hypothetical protein